MMGQELFEHPRRQYVLYGITVCETLSKEIPSPELLETDDISERQHEAMLEVLEAHPEAALTFDEAAQLWIVGAEDDLNRMFTDREEFIEALEANEDPGL